MTEKNIPPMLVSKAYVGCFVVLRLVNEATMSNNN